MKKILIPLLCLLTAIAAGMQPAKAQADELAQLALDIEKLTQFKKILSDMYTGYAILTKGYNTIRDLAQGNFNLHKVFLDGLLAVSPTVQKYKRIPDIISCQTAIIKEYKRALSHFRDIKVFSTDEMTYLQSVYDNLFNRSLQNLDELLLVITANKLRMNDAERLNEIDRIYRDIQDKLNFLQYFNNNTYLLAAQRQKELQDTKSIQRLYGTQN